MTIVRFAFRVIVVLGGALALADAADNVPLKGVTSGATPVEIPGLRNTFRVTERIFSGSQPDSDTAFAALAELGVKTILSVDGSKPDVERAHKFGLKYVHLPFGYGGVPTNRVAELTKVMSVRPGPFYVHCRHGAYRGPAAVAVMCESTEGWSSAQALQWLRQAGGSGVHPGLDRSVREFRKPGEAELKAATDFQEAIETSSLVKRMVLMDQHVSGLKQSQKSGWITTEGRVDVGTRRHAIVLWDQFRKLYTTRFLDGRPEDFQEKMLAALKAAEELNALISSTSPRKEALDAALERSAQTCTTCHRRYRNQ